MLFTDYYSGYQIKENEIGRACGTYDRQERCTQVSSEETRNETVHLQDLVVDGRIVLKCILKSGDGKAWIGLL